MYIRYHFTPLTYSHETALDSGQMYELCIDFSIHLRVSYIGFIIDGRREHKVMYEERNGGANGE
ncbi:hypothetical protein YC2023_041403 [Brassica napus]